jgi:2-(1,2-epoxy-1,2-dihydrophenyl)acetyl-CoA isomerase
MDEVRIERSDGVVTVTLNRPERRNALSVPMWTEVARQLAEIQGRPEDRAVILTGAGGVFCAGGDLGSAAADGEPAQGRERARSQALGVLQSTVVAVALALHRLSKPTIAAVDGIAAGAGANLALGCDLVLASTRARFGQVFIRRALPIDSGGTWLLPRLIGIQKAKELAFFGEWVEAADAERLGLVNRVMPAAKLAETAREWAARLASQSAPALALIKQGINRAFETPFAQALDDEVAALALCTATPEAAEALRAFFEKRGR